ncbi:hypothetical protein NE237_017041 [Protea cynaroides]|uniref:HhH-GPD domain-containing protein n=1 Tax=Protea cynaroides TaxID=273540 RepID=A0A9Q0K7A7_9MAGN|nr:hypothetical protein NE237_017041 [Protea cynaroides]
MLLLMNQHGQQQQPPPFLPPSSVSVPFSSSMGEQTQPQVPVQTLIHHHPQPHLHTQSQPSIQPQTQPQLPIEIQSQCEPQIQSQTQLQPQLQLPQPQSQLQPQPQPQPQSLIQTQTQPLPHNPLQLQPNAGTSQAVDATTVATSSPHYTSSASKLPFRPRKIRKVSADVSADSSENKAPQAIDGDKATPTPPTNVTVSNKKNSRGSKIAPTAISATVTTTVVNDGNRVPVQPIRVIPRIVGKTLSCEGEVAAAIRHLRAADPQLACVIDVYQPPSFDTFQPPFLALTKSILYQQLAYKAGTSIYTRFVALCGGEAGVVPDAVLSLSLHQLRQIGVSARKASYLHDLASKYRKGILSDSSIFDMDDKSLFAMLTMVKGIGSWSVHMFMIFSLHRPDVLPVGDLGVRKGVQLLYGLEELPRPSQMEQLCEKWRPYRSVGAWYMWRFAEAKGAQASAAAVAVGASQPQLQQQQPPPLPQQHQQHELLDPINSIASLGACAWGQ